jgi:hypothetical protein
MGVGGRAGKRLTDLGLAHFDWVACWLKAEDPRGPMHGSLLGAVMGVSGTDRLLRLSRERRDRGGRVGQSRWAGSPFGRLQARRHSCIGARSGASAATEPVCPGRAGGAGPDLAREYLIRRSVRGRDAGPARRAGRKASR